jgi:phosphoglycolate phosphatase
MGKRNTIIFDMDGTLLNTLDDIADSLNYSLEYCGYPTHSVKAIRKMIGGGASILLQKGAPKNLPEKEMEALKQVFLEHYFKNANNKTDLYDGIRELISRLKEEDFQMGIVSNKGDKAVKELNQVYFQDQMAMALGERPDIQRKPAPDALYLAMEMLGGLQRNVSI